MTSVIGVLGDHLVDAHRRDLERARVRHDQAQIARKGSARLISKSRRVAGAFIIGVGKVIEGRHLVEPRIDLDPVRDAPLKLAG